VKDAKEIAYAPHNVAGDADAASGRRRAGRGGLAGLRVVGVDFGVDALLFADAEDEVFELAAEDEEDDQQGYRYDKGNDHWV